MLFCCMCVHSKAKISINQSSLYLSSRRNHILASALFCKEISLLLQSGVFVVSCFGGEEIYLSI